MLSAREYHNNLRPKIVQNILEVTNQYAEDERLCDVLIKDAYDTRGRNSCSERATELFTMRLINRLENIDNQAAQIASDTLSDCLSRVSADSRSYMCARDFTTDQTYTASMIHRRLAFMSFPRKFMARLDSHYGA